MLAGSGVAIKGRPPIEPALTRFHAVKWDA